jgi:hypothetical protein
MSLVFNIAVFVRYGEQTTDAGGKAKVDTTWTEIDKMLECIPADTDRQTWLNVAMAVHEFDYISNEKLGYSKFLEWSKTGELSTLLSTLINKCLLSLT